VKEKGVTKIEWIIKKNLKMNETLEKEQMMKQMNSNLQNKMHKQRQKWSIFMYKLRIKKMSVLEILDLVGVQKSIHPIQDTTAAPTQLYIRTAQILTYRTT
jgi:hypothetical protein